MSEIGKAIHHLTMLCRIDSGEKKSLYELAISALEKQIPKKPNNIIKSEIENGGLYGECPCCEEWLESLWISEMFCQKCGQAIDWSVEE